METKPMRWHDTVSETCRALGNASFRDSEGNLLGADEALDRLARLAASLRDGQRSVYLVTDDDGPLAGHFAAALAAHRIHSQCLVPAAPCGWRQDDMLVAFSSAVVTPVLAGLLEDARRAGLEVVTISATEADIPVEIPVSLSIHVDATSRSAARLCQTAILLQWLDRLEGLPGATPVEGRHPLFDRSRLALRPLAERVHDWGADRVRGLEPVRCTHEELAAVASEIRQARETGRPVLLFIGAHVLRAGVQRYLIDLIERGMVTCIAGSGACAIHDFEVALAGATTESVTRYIREGQFGLWRETGELNTIVNQAARHGLGLGEAVGQAILKRRLPFQHLSVYAAAHRCGVLATVHVGIGCDIVHEHPNCNGGSYGETSYRDFLRLAAHIEQLDGGVAMTFGSAVTAPEVFLKALAMARNVAHAEGRRIRHFTTLVCDLHHLPDDYRAGPPRDTPLYYYRPWKTLLARTVADGGTSYYVRGDHGETFPQVWTLLSRPTPTDDGREVG